MYQGYCLIPDGGWYPPVKLDDEKAAITYCQLHMKFFPEIRIVDDEDYIVLHAVGGKIVFPTKEDEDETEY